MLQKGGGSREKLKIMFLVQAKLICEASQNWMAKITLT